MTGRMNQASGGYRAQAPSRFDGAPVTKWLLILNLAVFVLDFAAAGALSSGRFKPLGAFMIDLVFERGQVWRLLSFQFLHANWMHLLANMLGIYMFGGIVERVLGSRRFVAFYLLCGVSGALFYTLLSALGWFSYYGVLVGASAGIFGILVALVVIAPDMRVMLLFPPIPMKMKTLGMLALGIGVYTVLTHGKNDGGEAGHLGGALFGWILMMKPQLLNWTERVGKKRSPKRRAKVVKEAKIRPRTVIKMDADEVDRILDKVNEQGMHSLSDAERKTLIKLSNKD